MITPRRRNRRRPEGGGVQWLATLRSLVGSMRAVAGVLALLAGVGVMVWGVLLSLDRPVGKVEVGGQFQRVAPVQIEEAIAPFRGAGFLSIDLDALQASVESIPWVDRARVERMWPNGVRVFITEHVAAARWGESGLMNTRGELFLTDARHIPPELPQLVGPPGTEAQVATLYLETYPRLLGVGMRLSRVMLDERGAWQLTLANGVEVRLGRQDVPSRLERFIRVASPIIASRASDVRQKSRLLPDMSKGPEAAFDQRTILYIDLRYSNGFSVGWNAHTRVARDAEDARTDG